MAPLQQTFYKNVDIGENFPNLQQLTLENNAEKGEMDPEEPFLLPAMFSKVVCYRGMEKTLYELYEIKS